MHVVGLGVEMKLTSMEEGGEGAEGLVDSGWNEPRLIGFVSQKEPEARRADPVQSLCKREIRTCTYRFLSIRQI